MFMLFPIPYLVIAYLLAYIKENQIYATESIPVIFRNYALNDPDMPWNEVFAYFRLNRYGFIFNIKEGAP
jgi:hypothetical protein